MTMQINGSVGITFPDGTLQTTAAGGGTVANVTAVTPLSSSGGPTPAISLTGIVPAANGGTGAASLTGVLFGNGASPATPATAAQLITVLGTTPVARATALAGGAANQILFQSAAGVTAFAAAPTVAGTALEWDGTNFVWNAAGSGSVNSVSVVSANGFAGTVATPTSTPAITISTSVTGVLLGNGTAISAAAASDITTLLGTTPVDRSNNITGGTANQIAFQSAPNTTAFIPAPTVTGTALEWDGTNFVWNTAGAGTVTSASVATANGFAGTVATPTTTPVITITTGVTGLLKGDGTAISAASASDISTLLGSTPVTTATNLAGGLAGSLPYQNAAGSTSMLAAGTPGQVLRVSAGNLPEWGSPAAAAALTIGTGLDGTSYNTSTAVTIKLADTAVSPNTYGTAIAIPVITVDQQGRITNVTTASTVGVEYIGVWDASTNTPTIPAPAPSNQGEYYVCNVAGSAGGYGTFAVGDWIVSSGTGWDKVNNSQTTSVANFSITGIAAGRYLIGGGGSPITGQVGVPAADITGTLGAGFGGTGHATYTTGDTLYASAATTLTKLGIGAAGFVMTSTGSAPQWVNANTLTVNSTSNLAGGATGSLPYQTSTGNTVFLAAGANGQVLTLAGGVPTWAASSAGTVTSVAVSGGTTGLTTSGGPITAAGTITLAGTLNVANGGTGAATLTGYVKGTGTTAMTASATIPSTDITGLGTMSTQNANAVAVTGGAINGAVIGGTTPAAITGTVVTATTFVGVSGGTF